MRQKAINKGTKTVVKKSTSININGKRYDALTGNLLHDPIVPRRPGKSVDGISKPSTAAVASPAKPKPLPASQVPRSRAPHAKAHSVHTSQTLMRHAVKKPTTPSVKRRAKVQHAVTPVVAIHPAVRVEVARKHSVHRIDNDRLQRATKAATSTKVSHFARDFSVIPQEVAQQVTALNKAFVLPEAPKAPVHVYRTEAAAQAAAKRPDIFEQALIRATSHEEPAVTLADKRRRRKAARSLRQRMVSYGAGAMVMLAIVGFVSFTSSDSMKFRVATRSVGFSATMPSYTPKGFSVAKVNTQSGYVNVSYVRDQPLTNSNRSFALTQKASSLSDQALMYNLSATNVAFSTVQTPKGPVYLYGRNQAAWVRSGVLYQVLGNGVLNTTDFTQLASSI